MIYRVQRDDKEKKFINDKYATRRRVNAHDCITLNEEHKANLASELDKIFNEFNINENKRIRVIKAYNNEQSPVPMGDISKCLELLKTTLEALGQSQEQIDQYFDLNSCVYINKYSVLKKRIETFAKLDKALAGKTKYLEDVVLHYGSLLTGAYSYTTKELVDYINENKGNIDLREMAGRLGEGKGFSRTKKQTR